VVFTATIIVKADLAFQKMDSTDDQRIAVVAVKSNFLGVHLCATTTPDDFFPELDEGLRRLTPFGTRPRRK